MKILLTGGAGYIGSILTNDLLREDHSVTVLDNFSYGQSSLNHLCHHRNFNVIKGDVRDSSLLRNEIKVHDVIIPLAALVGAPLCNFNKVGARTINYDSIISLLSEVSQNQLILMPTTNSAYGSGDDQNMCDETSELHPLSNYAIDKVEVEQKLMEHPNSISFRLATVFGMSPRMRLDLLVNDFTYRAVNDKFVVLFESTFKRNYIHVRDVSKVFLHGINNYDKMKNQIFNVGLSEANLSKEELCKRIKKIIPQFSYFEDSLQEDPDKRNYIVSNDKIESTGFKPDWSIDAGIKELIKGFKMINNRKYGNI
ncbi:NAD(P)-dependent oxidoreductase [Betaproteobacteria bacterium]|nr:NAD(P)-dependent oxidoreductase [Betaproteobacteria bacterium]